MKIIFLETEGVLMLPVCSMTARLLQKPVVAFKPCVDALNLIVQETGAELVLTCESRKAHDSISQTVLADWGVNIVTFDRIPTIGKNKGTGILKYMSMSGEPESFVIIDKTDDGYGKMLRQYLIVADPEKGLTDEMARRAIGILKGEEK